MQDDAAKYQMSILSPRFTIQINGKGYLDLKLKVLSNGVIGFEYIIKWWLTIQYLIFRNVHGWNFYLKNYFSFTRFDLVRSLTLAKLNDLYLQYLDFGFMTDAVKILKRINKIDLWTLSFLTDIFCLRFRRWKFWWLRKMEFSEVV